MVLKWDIVCDKIIVPQNKIRIWYDINNNERYLEGNCTTITKQNCESFCYAHQFIILDIYIFKKIMNKKFHNIKNDIIPSPNGSKHKDEENNSGNIKY